MQGHGDYSPSSAPGETVYKSLRMVREKLLKRLPWKSAVFLKYSDKCRTNVSGEFLTCCFRDSLLAGEALYIQFAVHAPQNAPSSQ